MQPRLLKHPARLAGASLLRLQDDQRLVALAREGHDPAFTAIVDRYGAQLERYCARLLGPGRAEDAVQQAFVNAHAAMRSSEQELALKPWLYRIAHNAALNILRAAKDEGEALDEDRACATHTADVVELREQLRETLASIQALPTAQRDALLLREIEGRSHAEIALTLGVTAGGARQHLHRARVAMRAAASAVTPYPLLSRVLSAAASESGRSADLVSGAGLGAGAGALKAAASLLAAGAIAGGAVTVQHHGTGHSRTAAQSAALHRSTKTSSAASSPSAVALDAAGGGTAGAPTRHGRGRGGVGARHARGTSGIDRRHGAGSLGFADVGFGTSGGGGSGDRPGGSSNTSGKSGGGEVHRGGSGSGSDSSGSSTISDSGSNDTTSGSISGSDGSGGSSSSGSDGGGSSASSGGGGSATTTVPSGDPPETDTSGSGHGSDGPTVTTPSQ